METASISSNALLEPKSIELCDLLGRPELHADIKSVAGRVEGKVVLATGAGGSIGSELCWQIASFKPRRLILPDSSEYLTHLLNKEMRAKYPELDIQTALVDVRRRRVQRRWRR